MNGASSLPKLLIAALACVLLAFQTGCAGPAASKPVKGAGTGALVGAGAGAIAGGDAATIAGAGVAGAAIGAAVGAIQQSNERKRQDTLAQQRAYNQAIAMQKRKLDKAKSELQSELDIAEGMRITEAELQEMTARAEIAEEKQKELEARMNAAIERKKQLDELVEREKEALAEIERLERELAELEADAGLASSDS